MSLINKMLQDLDARGGSGDASAQPQEVKAVPSAERDRRPLLIGAAALGVLVLAAAGWYGWQYWKAHSAPAAAPVLKIVDNRVPIQARAQQAPAATDGAADERAAGTTAANAAGGSGGAPAAAPLPAASPASAIAPMPSAPAAAQAPAAPEAQSPPHATADLPPRAQSAAKPPRAVVARAHEDDHVDMPRPRKPAAAAHAAPADGVVLRELTPKQISENSYRRALAALQEGRVSAALADLDKAVETDPRNDAARQTYVSLLLENRRTDDAIRQLRLALGIEPRQPGLAMVLARLQLEKGGPALDTLLKTLPYATNNADYQAFLAGVLQREQRHAEAAEHYREALAIAPGNAVWWMGLGISLQADQHLPEAREAYKQARKGAGLTPELTSFIDRKLDQLAR